MEDETVPPRRRTPSLLRRCTMSRATVRWTLAGAVALAAAGVTGGLEAEAAQPSAGPSPFAGSYLGGMPGQDPTGPSPWPITVASDAAVSGTRSWIRVAGNHSQLAWRMVTELTGRVRSTGQLSVTCTETQYDLIAPVVFGQHQFKVNARMTKNADGSLTGTTNDGATFVWTPQ